MDKDSKCPVAHGAKTRSDRNWWPDRLDLQVLNRRPPQSDPLGGSFDYAKELKSLDLNAVIADLHRLMTDSQPWWPADFGHYGGLFIRLDGTAQEPIASRTAAAEQAAVSNVLHR